MFSLHTHLPHLVNTGSLVHNSFVFYLKRTPNVLFNSDLINI